MPIRRFLGRDTFDPAHLAVMGTAFTAALDKLGLKKHNDPVVQVLAHKIIWAARNGERDQKKAVRSRCMGRGGRLDGVFPATDYSPLVGFLSSGGIEP